MKWQQTKKYKKYIYIAICAVIAIAVVSAAVFCFFHISPKEEPPKNVTVEGEDIPAEDNLPETETPAETETETPVSGNDAPAEDMEYPEPEYPFYVEEVEVPLEGIESEYRIAWVSDLHLITDHEAGDVSVGYLVTVKRRYNNLAITEDGVHAEELWPDIVKFLNAGDFDAVIFGGDMMDYCSSSNMEVFREGYDALRPDMEILYLRADHDYGAWYAGDTLTQNDIYELHKELDGDDLERKYLDFGEFIIIGINLSTSNLSEEYLQIIENLYETDKPIIAATHVPYESEVDDSLAELSMQVRGTKYYWNGDTYKPNTETQEYFNLIYGEDTKVRQVLAGHLHASWDGMLTEEVPEHIFGPAFGGNVGVIHVVPEK